MTAAQPANGAPSNSFSSPFMAPFSSRGTLVFSSFSSVSTVTLEKRLTLRSWEMSERDMIVSSRS